MDLNQFPKFFCPPTSCLWAGGRQWLTFYWQTIGLEPVHCTLKSIQCTLNTVQYTLYIVHCTLYTVQCTMYTVYCTLNTAVWYILYCTVYCTLSENVQCKLQYSGLEPEFAVFERLLPPNMTSLVMTAIKSLPVIRGRVLAVSQ